MPQPFVEYRETDISEPLRQGDVLEATDAEAPVWRRLLFVLTADCDLAHQKHNGLLTCVPLMEQDDYLSELGIPRIRDRLLKKAISDLQEIMKGHGRLGVSDERLAEWVCESGDESIALAIGITDSEEVRILASRLAAVRLICGSGRSLDAAIEDLVGAQMLSKSPPKPENARRNVVGLLRESFANPPGDAFFLSTIARGRDVGYFAYLRHIEQVQQAAVATAPNRRPSDYRRIARLQDRFTHAVVQKFAMMFLPIGLPSEYEDARAVYASLIGES